MSKLRCDMCSAGQVAWDYPVADYEVLLPDGRIYVSRGGWVLCEDCAAVVERNELPIMHTFCVQRLEGITDTGAGEWIEKVKAFQALFLEHRTGPREPVR